MVTGAQLTDYLKQVTAEYQLAGNSVGLKHVQSATSVLSSAASAAGSSVAALTDAQLCTYLEQTIAAEHAAANAPALKDTQDAAGVLMAAAEYAGDKSAAHRLHILAADAANRRAEILK